MSGAAAAATILQDHSAAVGTYFSSIRLPASFLAGASFSGLFQLTSSAGNDAKPIDSFLIMTYSTTIALSFFMSMNTIILATAAGIKHLAGGYDPMAESGYMLLNSAFHFEFVISKWSFLMSLFLFLFAVTSRMLLEFKLLSSEGPLMIRNRQIGLAICLLMSSFVFHLLSFVNSTLFCWNNYFEMTLDVIKTLATRGSMAKPLEPLSVILAAAGVGIIAHALSLK